MTHIEIAQAIRHIAEELHSGCRGADVYIALADAVDALHALAERIDPGSEALSG